MFINKKRFLAFDGFSACMTEFVESWLVYWEEGRGGGNDDLLLLSIIMLQLRSRKRGDKIGRWGGGGQNYNRIHDLHKRKRGGGSPLKINLLAIVRNCII